MPPGATREIPRPGAAKCRSGHLGTTRRHSSPTRLPPLRIAPFSLTPGGEAVLTSVGPQVEGSVTAYVDAAGPRGFFVVEVKLTEIF